MAQASTTRTRQTTDTSTVLPRRAAIVGPSMRARARIMVVAAFAVALPALIVGMVRIDTAEAENQILTEVSSLTFVFRDLRQHIVEARLATYRLEAEPSPDARRALKISLDQLSREILDAEGVLEEILNTPSSPLAAAITSWTARDGDDALLPTMDPLRRVKETIAQARIALEPSLRARQGARPEGAQARRAHEGFLAAERDVNELVRQSMSLAHDRGRRNADSISRAARDQLVLFLLMLSIMPLLMTLGPSWMTAPVERLRGAARRIATGRGKELIPSSDDEVGEVTRALKEALTRLEESDQKKTHKIFEMKKLIRALLARLDEVVFVVGRGGQIDYVSERATRVLGSEKHHLEGKPLEDVCFSPLLVDSIDRVRSGNTADKDIPIVLEPADGRVLKMNASVVGVQDQDGRVSRVVVVLHA
jgi:PAS domain S-box-containing protein